MPVKLERRLRRQAKKKGIEDPDAYVYGTMRKTGWEPGKSKSKKVGSKKNAISKDAIKRRVSNDYPSKKTFSKSFTKD